MWSGHKFTDEEVAALLDGGEIEVYDVVNSNGVHYACKLHLEEYEYDDRIVDGLKITESIPLYCYGEWNGEKIRFKVVWGGHKFTEEECEKLLAGDEISFDYVSKNGKTLSVKGRLEKTNPERNPRFIPDW